MARAFEAPGLSITGEDPTGPPVESDSVWEVRLDGRGGVWGYVRADGGGGSVYLPRIATYEFNARNRQVNACRAPGAADGVVVDAYYRHALPLALHFYGVQVLHASAVRGPKGVHVFCGTSHAGKSTVAYALLQRGYEIWADDAVAFTAVAGTATAVPLPFTLRLRDETVAFFQRAGIVKSPDNGKVELPQRAEAKPLAIASVSLLESAPATISRVPPSESLPAILNHAFYFSLRDEAVRRRMAAEFLELIANAPLSRVALPRGFERLDGALDQLEEHVLGAGRASPS